MDGYEIRLESLKLAVGIREDRTNLYNSDEVENMMRDADIFRKYILGETDIFRKYILGETNDHA